MAVLSFWMPCGGIVGDGDCVGVGLGVRVN